jgi:hypothetical protein
MLFQVLKAVFHKSHSVAGQGTVKHEVCKLNCKLKSAEGSNRSDFIMQWREIAVYCFEIEGISYRRENK